MLKRASKFFDDGSDNRRSVPSEPAPAPEKLAAVPDSPRSHPESQLASPSELFSVAVENCAKGLGLGLNEQNYVLYVTPASPAAASGEIKAGDRIVAVDGVDIVDGRSVDWWMAVNGASSNNHILTVRRLAQMPTWSGTVWKKSPAGPMYQKRELVVENSTIKYLSGKGEPVELRCQHIERVKVANADRLEFALLTHKQSPENGRVYNFRVESQAEFEKWTQGLQKILSSLALAAAAASASTTSAAASAATAAPPKVESSDRFDSPRVDGDEMTSMGGRSAQFLATLAESRPLPKPPALPPRAAAAETDASAAAWEGEAALLQFVRTVLRVPCEGPMVRVTGGLTNASWLLGQRGPLLKAYGATGSSGLTDRARERKVVSHLMAKAPNATKRVLAWFEGGHVEEWLEGATVPFAAMMDETHAPQIGALLARLHACPLPPDDASQPAAAATERFWDEQNAWATSLPESWGGGNAAAARRSSARSSTAGGARAAAPGREALLAELAWLRARVAASPTCICHRDVHGANLVRETARQPAAATATATATAAATAAAAALSKRVAFSAEPPTERASADTRPVLVQGDSGSGMMYDPGIDDPGVLDDPERTIILAPPPPTPPPPAAAPKQPEEAGAGAGAGGGGGALRLIDFEFACAAPRAFDVANFFLECAFVEETESWDWDRAPRHARKLAFARAYATAYNKAAAAPSNTNTTSAAPLGAEALLREWEQGWNLAAHLWNVLWALTIAKARDDEAFRATAQSGASPLDRSTPRELSAVSLTATDSERERAHEMAMKASAAADAAAAAADAEPEDDAATATAPDDAFDYLGYAVSRWERYLWEKCVMRSGLWAGVTLRP